MQTTDCPWNQHEHEELIKKVLFCLLLVYLLTNKVYMQNWLEFWLTKKKKGMEENK